MNKAHSLLYFSAVCLLCACSAAKAISPEEAKKLLQENSEHVQDESFLMPTSLSTKAETTINMFRKRANYYVWQSI